MCGADGIPPWQAGKGPCQVFREDLALSTPPPPPHTRRRALSRAHYDCRSARKSLRRALVYPRPPFPGARSSPAIRLGPLHFVGEAVAFWGPPGSFIAELRSRLMRRSLTAGQRGQVDCRSS